MVTAGQSGRALNAEFDYVLVHTPGRILLLALPLAETCLARYELLSDDAVEAELPKPSFKGRVLEHLRVAHPFQAYDVPVILGDHVTADAGTGAVHTAPAHGQEDFTAARRYNLAVPNPTGNDGRFLADTAAGRWPETRGGRQADHRDPARERHAGP